MGHHLILHQLRVAYDVLEFLQVVEPLLLQIQVFIFVVEVQNLRAGLKFFKKKFFRVLSGIEVGFMGFSSFCGLTCLSHYKLIN